MPGTGTPAPFAAGPPQRRVGAAESDHPSLARRPTHLGACSLALGPSRPTGQDILTYITDLYHAVTSPNVRELDQVQKMKKYLSFIAPAAEPTGQFLHAIRRVTTKADFFATCERWLVEAATTPRRLA